jgi:hypothetical protein
MRNLTLTLILLAILARPAAPARAQDPVGYLYSQINALRTGRGYGALTINSQLTAAAQGHANYLATTIYIHPHRQRNGSLPQDRAEAAGYVGRVSENVVGGTNASVEWAFNWWLNSPVHYANMLGNWTEVGIAVANGGEYGRWYVVVFGNPGRAAPPAEGVTGTNPNATPIPNQNRVAQATRPRPTLTPSITFTPTLTLTPSMTFTPRATFTPTDTPTLIPATPTPFIVEVTPQGAVAPSQTAPPPSQPPPTTAVALAAPLPTLLVASPAPPAATTGEAGGNPNLLRSLIPVALVLQAVILGGIVVRGVLRRR